MKMFASVALQIREQSERAFFFFVFRVGRRFAKIDNIKGISGLMSKSENLTTTYTRKVNLRNTVRERFFFFSLDRRILIQFFAAEYFKGVE